VISLGGGDRGEQDRIDGGETATTEPDGKGGDRERPGEGLGRATFEDDLASACSSDGASRHPAIEAAWVSLNGRYAYVQTVIKTRCETYGQSKRYVRVAVGSTALNAVRLRVTRVAAKHGADVHVVGYPFNTGSWHEVYRRNHGVRSASDHSRELEPMPPPEDVADGRLETSAPSARRRGGDVWMAKGTPEVRAPLGGSVGRRSPSSGGS
jgi:hypothetical protein